MESELIQLSSGCEDFSLNADLNAKTGNIQDYISKDEKLSQYLDLRDDSDFLDYMDDFIHCTN